MAALIVLFNLREGIDPADYENWAATVDVPTVTGLSSVDDFAVYRIGGVMGSDQPPPYRYCEVITVNDMALLGEEIQTEEMQKIAATFQGHYADSPTFLTAERFA